MYPIIFVSKKPEDWSEYLNTFTKENDFLPIHIDTISPEKKELSIDQIRKLKREIQTIPGHKRLIVIEGLGVSGHEAQNALLKVLEEQTEHNQFLFPVSTLGSVLPTIQSRCKIVVSLAEKNVEIRPETRELLDLATSKKEEQILASDLITSITRESALLLLEECLVYFQIKLHDGTDVSPSLLKQILKTRILLQNNNLNPQLTIDTIVLAIQNNY